MVVLKFFRRPAQSSGAHEVSLGKISSVVGKNRIKYLDTEICFYVLVECEAPLALSGNTHSLPIPHFCVHAVKPRTILDVESDYIILNLCCFHLSFPWLEEHHPDVTTDPVFEVDVQGEGRLAMERINKKLGLAFDDWDLEYYCKLFKEKIGRNPTSIECFDLAQSNSSFMTGRLLFDRYTNVLVNGAASAHFNAKPSYRTESIKLFKSGLQ